MSVFKFDSYDVDEVGTMGERFSSFVTSIFDAYSSQRIPTPVWTDAVLAWFAAAARDGTCIDGARAPSSWRGAPARVTPNTSLGDELAGARSAYGEFLKLDLVHSTWPTYSEESSYLSRMYWDQVSSPSDPNTENIEILLALESEWKGTTSEKNYACVLHSASKLSAIRSRCKVLIFGSRIARNGIDTREAISDSVAMIRRRTRDSAPWLLVDIPNQAEGDPPRFFARWKLLSQHAASDWKPSP